MEHGFIIFIRAHMLYLASTSRIISHIRVLAVQGILLFLICFLGHREAPLLSLTFLTVETLVVKAIIIPWFLYKILRKTRENRDEEANIPHFYCLVISSIILLGCFFGFKLLHFIRKKYFPYLFWDSCSYNHNKPLADYNKT